MLDHIATLMGISSQQEELIGGPHPPFPPTQAQTQFWISVFVGTSLSILGCSSIILLFLLLGKGQKQHSRFILNISIYDLLFSSFCLVACAVNYGDNAVLIDDVGCLQAPHFSYYMFVWFFYFSAISWIVALTFLSCYVITTLKPSLPIKYEIGLHIIIFLYAFFITWGPNLFTDDWIFASNTAICIWGSPLYSTLTFVPLGGLLLLFWAITAIKLITFKSSHKATQTKIRRTFQKTLLFVIIFLTCNIPKYVSIWNVIDSGAYNGFAVVLLHVQGMFDGFAYGWNEVVVPALQKSGVKLGWKGSDETAMSQSKTYSSGGSQISGIATKSYLNKKPEKPVDVVTATETT